MLSPATESKRRGSILLRMMRFTRVARTLRLLRVMGLFQPMRNLLDTCYASLGSLMVSMATRQ